MAEDTKTKTKKEPKRANKLTNARIKKEIEFLQSMFAGIDDEDKKSLVNSLVEEAAFLKVACFQAKEELKNKLAIEEWVNSYVGAAKELAQLNQDRCNGGKTKARYVLCKYNYTLPTVFLIRHAAELAIKEAIDKSGKEPNNSTHDLDKLWSSLLSQLPKSKTQTDRQIINQAHKFLQYISHLDNDGTKVRYPVDKNGNYTHAEFEWIDCIKLSNTLDAFVTTLRSIDWEHVKASKGKETKKEG